MNLITLRKCQLLVYLQRLHDSAANAAAVLGRQVELVLDVHHQVLAVLPRVKTNQRVGHVSPIVEEHQGWIGIGLTL